MNELTNIKARLQDTLAQIEKFESKQTKATSARIRIALGEIKKSVTSTRAALVREDKAGY